MATDLDVPGLGGALQMLAGTNTEEQVFIEPTTQSQSWHLDVVEVDEEDGPRFAVYAEYGGDLPFDRRGLRFRTDRSSKPTKAPTSRSLSVSSPRMQRRP